VRRLVLLLAVLALGVTADSADAISRGRCKLGHSGPMCFFWTGKVTAVNDGDTISVDIDGDGTHRSFRVRFSSIQAMEQSVYSPHPSRRRGECHALEATAFDEQLIKRSHKRVRLSAQHKNAMSDRRLRRSVAVRIGGRWQNLGSILMREGHTLWLPGLDEDVWNAEYDRLGQEARQRGKLLWNPTYCGPGPHQEVPLRMWVNWDPEGVDTQQVDDEWIKIQNQSATTALPLGDWWVRDSNHRRITFRAGTEIAPGATLTVYTRRGTDSNSSVFWNFRAPIFENPGDRHHLGDGAYLFDPQGDLRLAAQYPCLVACSDPLDGAIDLTVQSRGQREYLDIENASAGDVDLYGYQVVKPGYQYIFDNGSTLHAGEKLRIYANGNPSNDTRLVRYWGLNHPMYADSGGNILFRNFTDKTLACDAWGNGRCP
jgi:endonuclease YncB( thermonuclease family)